MTDIERMEWRDKMKEAREAKKAEREAAAQKEAEDQAKLDAYNAAQSVPEPIAPATPQLDALIQPATEAELPPTPTGVPPQPLNMDNLARMVAEEILSRGISNLDVTPAPPPPSTSDNPVPPMSDKRINFINKLRAGVDITPEEYDEANRELNNNDWLPDWMRIYAGNAYNPAAQPGKYWFMWPAVARENPNAEPEIFMESKMPDYRPVAPAPPFRFLDKKDWRAAYRAGATRQHFCFACPIEQAQREVQLWRERRKQEQKSQATHDPTGSLEAIRRSSPHSRPAVISTKGKVHGEHEVEI